MCQEEGGRGAGGGGDEEAEGGPAPGQGEGGPPTTEGPHPDLGPEASTATATASIIAEMTFDGLTESNFEAVKNDLTNSVASALGVSSSSVELDIKSTSRKRSDGIVVVATITTTELDVVDDVQNSIESGTFASDISNEVQNSPSLQDIGLTFTGVSEVVVVSNGEYHLLSF